MATDKTERLIVDLVAGMAPVKRLPAVSVRLAQWLAIAAGAAGAFVWFFGVRADLSHALGTPEVLASLGLALVASGSAAIVALRLSVPGRDASQWTRWTPLVIVAVWTALLAEMARSAGLSITAIAHEPFHAACVSRVVAIAAIPTLALARSLWRGFPLDRVWTPALAVLAGSALAAVAVQLVCPIDRPAHLLVSHALPVIALGALGAFAGKLGRA